MNRIKELRLEKGLSQGELGDILGLSQQTISGYENETRDIDSATLKMLADYFDTTTDYLLGRTNIRDLYEIQTIAAHHDGEEWTEEELEDIEKFKEYVRMRRKQ